MGIWEKDPVKTVDFGRVLRIIPKLAISESFSESFSEEEFNSIAIPKLILRMILRMILKLGMAIELTSSLPFPLGSGDVPNHTPSHKTYILQVRKTSFFYKV